MIQNKITPIAEIAYLNTGLLLLGQLDKEIRVDIHDCLLTDIQGMVYHLGGSIDLYNKKNIDSSYLIFGVFKTKIGKSDLACYFNLTDLAYSQQMSVFGSSVFVFEKGTELTIIDNSYFVFS